MRFRHRMSFHMAAGLVTRLWDKLDIVAAARAKANVYSARSELSGGGMDPLVAKHLWRALHFSDPRHRGQYPHRLRNLGRWYALYFKPRNKNTAWT